MRLFIAVNFDEKTKASLMGAVQKLKESSSAGNFTRPENLHLTLVFIGETKDAAAVKEAMEQVRGLPFALRIKGLGNLAGEEKIYTGWAWIGAPRWKRCRKSFPTRSVKGALQLNKGNTSRI